MENQTQLHKEVEELEEQLKLKKEMLKTDGGIDKSKLFLPVAIVFAAILISGTLLYSKSGSSNGGNTAAQQPNVAAGQQLGNQPSGSGKVSIYDDPVLGDKNAPLTIVEFSDYECPFCKRSFNDVLPELKKNYIDTGKLKLVYRDFPLSFHANAHKEAEAAECARSQGGDADYYKYNDQIFTQTTSNGTGLALTKLPVIAKNLGLDVTKFQQCLDSGKFSGEVDKDIADGSAAGVSGTPAWFIGKSSKDGTINATLVVGAQPFAAFKVVIDEELKKLGK